MQLEGYAITCRLGRICDASGRMPQALRFEADWRHFQAGLDRAALTVLGRGTHEAAPNRHGRQRLVLSRKASGLVRHDAHTHVLNPADLSLEAALARLVPADANVAIVGGTGLFELVLKGPGYDRFHLSVAHEVALADGRPLFPGTDSLDAAIGRLERAGLELAESYLLDGAERLELRLFARDRAL